MRGFLILCALAALAPLLGPVDQIEADAPPFPGWPTTFEADALERQPQVAGDAQFTERLEGRMARFRAGDREIVLRWTWRAGAGLHSGRHCYRGLGYEITPEPASLDARGRHWSRFTAARGGELLSIRELVYDEHGQSWPEVSAWYWDALRGRTAGAWWSALVVERADPPLGSRPLGRSR